MKHYYFIDDEIYFQGVKQPPRKVELFNVIIDMERKKFTGYDKSGDWYVLNIDEHELIVEEK